MEEEIVKKEEKTWCRFWPSWVPKRFEVQKSLPEYIREICQRFPDKPALDFYGLEMTYGELERAIDRFTHALLELGVKRGDRIALHMQNCPQFVISYFGILQAEGVVVSVNPMFKHPEIENELLDSQAEVYVGLDYLYPEVEKIQGKVPLKSVILSSLGDFAPSYPSLPLPEETLGAKLFYPGTLDFQEVIRGASGEHTCNIVDLDEDLALLQYTGGTTGLPKGAMITHKALAVASVGAGQWFGNTKNDVYLGVTPFFHIMGMVQMMCAPLLSGGKIVVLTRFSPDAVAQAIQERGCTAWVGATTMLIALLQMQGIKDYDLSSLRYICSGGSPVTPEIQKRVTELFPRALLADGYGLTESVSQGGAITPLGRFKSGYVGVPHLNDTRIMDAETGLREVPPNEEGEIVIKGPCLTKGYWNDPGETEKILRGGWLYTGDLGSMDDEGYVRYSGRVRELIKCSGFSVFPSDVEDLIYRHPAVAEVAVVGVPDVYRGESPKAVVILKEDSKGKITEQELLEWCKENMAAYKRPRFVEFRDELPKSGAGKILRRLLQ